MALQIALLTPRTTARSASVVMAFRKGEGTDLPIEMPLGFVCDECSVMGQHGRGNIIGKEATPFMRRSLGAASRSLRTNHINTFDDIVGGHLETSKGPSS